MKKANAKEIYPLFFRSEERAEAFELKCLSAPTLPKHIQEFIDDEENAEKDDELYWKWLVKQFYKWTETSFES